MALETNDILAVQKNSAGPGSLRKVLISEVLSLVPTPEDTYWERNTTNLSPVNDGDNLTGLGNITASGEIQAATGTFSGALEAESIDGGEYA